MAVPYVRNGSIKLATTVWVGERGQVQLTGVKAGVWSAVVTFNGDDSEVVLTAASVKSGARLARRVHDGLIDVDGGSISVVSDTDREEDVASSNAVACRDGFNIDTCGDGGFELRVARMAH